MSPQPRRLAVLALGASLALSACGLKPEQYDALRQQAAAGNQAALGGSGGAAAVPGAGGPAGGAAAAGTGSALGAAGGPGLTGGTAGSPGAQPGGPTGTSGGGATGATGGTRKPCSPPSGGDTTGITRTTIRIGIHAPQTGTGAPLPPSFKDGVQAYWNQPEHKICGRQVVVDFQDDQYNTTHARTVCEQMARNDFLVVGGAGTDQIQACATLPYIVQNHVPYLSAGVTTNGLTGLPHYFAFTLTYAQQSELVLKNARAQGFGGGKWAVVTSRTDNFKDARDSMEQVLTSAGIAYDDIQVNAVDDGGLQTRAAQTGTQIATGGYSTVYVDTAPGYFVYMTGAASKQGFLGTYTGPGVTMTEVTVAQLVCSGSGGVIKANFLAPYPGIDRATAEFKKATNNKYDDIYWSLWGLSQALEQALNAANSNLTRQNFIATLQNAALPGGAYNPIRFKGGHFGGTGAFSLKINCTETQPNQSQPGSWDTVGSAIFR